MNFFFLMGQAPCAYVHLFIPHKTRLNISLIKEKYCQILAILSDILQVSSLYYPYTWILVSLMVISTES